VDKVGLLEFGNRSMPKPGMDRSQSDNSFTQVWERMKAWFQGNF
jgi:cell division protein FtsA